MDSSSLSPQNRFKTGLSLSGFRDTIIDLYQTVDACSGPVSFNCRYLSLCTLSRTIETHFPSFDGLPLLPDPDRPMLDACQIKEWLFLAKVLIDDIDEERPGLDNLFNTPWYCVLPREDEGAMTLIDFQLFFLLRYFDEFEDTSRSCHDPTMGADRSAMVPS